jgi:hypothetical protein
MKKSTGTIAKPYQTNIIWPEVQLPPMIQTKTGETVMGQQHADAIVAWMKGTQQVLQQKIQEIAGQIKPS